MKHLLMISYPFHPNTSAGAVRSERFCRYLQKFGWNTDVVTIKPQENRPEGVARIGESFRNVRVHATSTLDPWLWARDKRPKNIIYRGLRSIVMKLFSFPDHMLLWIPFAISEGLAICKKRHIDAIYTTSPPHSTHLIGLVLSRLTGKPWVADFRDPWTLNAYHKKGGMNEVLLKIERLLESRILRKASIILANTQANRKNMLSAFSWINPVKVLHLPNGWEEFPLNTHDEDRTGPLRIVHAGTFYPRFKPYALLQALSDWRNGKKPTDVPLLGKKDIQVTIIGSNDGETRRIVAELDLEGIVEIWPWVAMDKARQMMQKANILWVSLGTGKQTSTYVPSKLFEYLAARRTIWGFLPEGEAAEIIRKTNSGIVFTSDKTGPIIKALAEALDHKKKGIRQYMANEQALGHYHIENVVSRLSSILNTITAQENLRS